MIRIVKPPARSLATPSVILPVTVYAEDDYGVSQIQVFRSLNDSRFMPSGLPLPETPLRRFHGQVDLPLKDYNLQPGDSIKLFVRAEDNDPAGAKGAESSVILIEIISQAQFEQMTLARDGMELMFSRYREALRRLEAAKEETDRLLQKLEQLPPDDPVSNDIKQELKKLAERMKKETEAIRKLAQHPLPFDLDQQLSAELEKAAKLTEEAAESIEKILDDNALRNESAKERLNEIGQKLSAGKQSFDQATMPPLELLAAVMPLKVAENRFIEIVKQQRDLAERLASLKGHDQEDDPAMKARMRELEEEQREIQGALNTLLDEIVERATLLPEREELEELRSSALEFAVAVRNSGALGAMGEAQNALAEYSGTKGHTKATEAADILEQLIPKCEGMGQCTSNCFRFSPSLGDCLSQTLDQLLNSMGFGSGSRGMMGAGNGIGAQRGGPNIGLYGMLPGMSAFAESQGRQQSGGQAYGSGGGANGMNPDFEEGYGVTAEGTIGGTSEGVIPLRYRQAVGRYFQRIVESGE